MQMQATAVTTAAAIGRSVADAKAPARNRPGPVTLILLAMCVGLATGLIELVFLASGWAYNPTTELAKQLVNHHYLWLVPSAHLIIFGTCGLVLGLVGWLWPKAGHRLAVWWLCGLSSLELFALVPELHELTYLLLAGGIASLLGPLLEAPTRHLRLQPRRVVPWALFAYAALILLSYGRDLVAERRALARLPAAVPGAPNIVLVVLDTVRADALSLYGYHRDTSPNLVRLAGRGVRFTRASAPSSWTLPSHSSMFTGRLPHELDVSAYWPLGSKYQTLAEALSASGYATAGFVGNNLFGHRDYGLARGFAHYEDWPVSLVEAFRSTRLGLRILRVIDLVRFKVSELWGDELFCRIFGDDPRYSLWAPPVKNAARVNRAALDWIAAHRGRPFFVFLNYIDAHDPFFPSRGARTRFGPEPDTGSDRAAIRDWPLSARASLPPATVTLVRDCYDTCIAALDDQVGRLLDELETLALLENTVVIVTSDHGEHFGKPRADLFGHGISLYPQLVHVPLLVIAPGRVPSGQTVTTPISLRDLPATVIELAGVAGGSTFPGRSLCRFWAADADSRASATEPVLAEFEMEVRPVDDPERYWESVTIGDMTWIRNAAGHYELYNTGADPEAMHNLAGSATALDVVDRFRSVADRFFAHARARLTPAQFGRPAHRQW
jgi:arylsulfatase A-like enzyme